MINFFDTMLQKMGAAFGIIFKILIPAILFFYPFKILLLGFLLLSGKLGFPIPFITRNSQIVTLVLYAIFVLVLIIKPKVASGIEFVLAPLYYVSLYFVYKLLFQVNIFKPNFHASAPYIIENKICAICMVVFIMFKILFFVFLILNRNNMNKSAEFYNY